MPGEARTLAVPACTPCWPQLLPSGVSLIPTVCFWVEREHRVRKGGGVGIRIGGVTNAVIRRLVRGLVAPGGAPMHTAGVGWQWLTRLSSDTEPDKLARSMQSCRDINWVVSVG